MSTDDSPRFEAYDLPYKHSVAQMLTTAEALRFEELGFYIKPMQLDERDRASMDELEKERNKTIRKQMQKTARQKAKVIAANRIKDKTR